MPIYTRRQRFLDKKRFLKGYWELLKLTVSAACILQGQKKAYKRSLYEEIWLDLYRLDTVLNILTKSIFHIRYDAVGIENTRLYSLFSKLVDENNKYFGIHLLRQK